MRTRTVETPARRNRRQPLVFGATSVIAGLACAVACGGQEDAAGPAEQPFPGGTGAVVQPGVAPVGQPGVAPVGQPGVAPAGQPGVAPGVVGLPGAAPGVGVDNPGVAPPGPVQAPVAPPVVPHNDVCADLLSKTPALPPQTQMRRLSWTEVSNAMKDLFPSVGVGSLAGQAEAELVPNRLPSRLLASETFFRAFRPAASEIAAQAASSTLANACAGGDAGCLEQELISVARRAWRSNLAGPERQMLSTEFAGFLTELTPEEAFAAGVELVLASPRFIYVADPGSLAADLAEPDGTHRARGERTAGMLAAALWASVPDFGLLDAAAAGGLDNTAGLQAEVSRMMDDPRARRGLTTFFRSWLGYRQVEKSFKNDELFPDFSDEVRAELVADTEQTLEALFFEDGGDPTSLLTSPLGFPGENQIEALGWDGISAGRADLSPVLRHGLATHPSILAMNSASGDTSVVNRGQYLVEKLACNHVPPPPPDVDADLDKLIDGAGRPLSNREIAELHASTPDCAGCHAFLDPFGIAFETYDATGAHRDTDRAGDIDTSVTINGPLGLNGTFANATELLDALAETEGARDCFAEQFAKFIKPQELTPAQHCVLSAHGVNADGTVASMSDIVQRFVTSANFLHRTL